MAYLIFVNEVMSFVTLIYYFKLRLNIFRNISAIKKYQFPLQKEFNQGYKHKFLTAILNILYDLIEYLRLTALGCKDI